jgi:hypothetical protein
MMSSSTGVAKVPTIGIVVVIALKIVADWSASRILRDNTNQICSQLQTLVLLMTATWRGHCLMMGMSKTDRKGHSLKL